MRSTAPSARTAASSARCAAPRGGDPPLSPPRLPSWRAAATSRPPARPPQASSLLRGSLPLDTWEFWAKVQSLGGYEEVGSSAGWLAGWLAGWHAEGGPCRRGACLGAGRLLGQPPGGAAPLVSGARRPCALAACHPLTMRRWWTASCGPRWRATLASTSSEGGRRPGGLTAGCSPARRDRGLLRWPGGSPQRAAQSPTPSPPLHTSRPPHLARRWTSGSNLFRITYEESLSLPAFDQVGGAARGGGSGGWRLWGLSVAARGWLSTPPFPPPPRSTCAPRASCRPRRSCAPGPPRPPRGAAARRLCHQVGPALLPRGGDQLSIQGLHRCCTRFGVHDRETGAAVGLGGVQAGCAPQMAS
jgi:hypothetical protein